MMEYTIFDFLGNIGVVLIIVSYILLQLDKLKSSTLLYSLTNAVGAGLILLSLIFRFNFSAFIVELFWLIISIVGVVRYVFLRKIIEQQNK